MSYGVIGSVSVRDGFVAPDAYQHQQREPGRDYHGTGNAAERFAVLGGQGGTCAAFDHDVCRNQPYRERYAERQQKQVVDQTKHGYEVWNQIDWAKRIGHDDDYDYSRMPRSCRMARCQVQSKSFGLKLLDSLLGACNERHRFNLDA